MMLLRSSPPPVVTRMWGGPPLQEDFADRSLQVSAELRLARHRLRKRILCDHVENGLLAIDPNFIVKAINGFEAAIAAQDSPCALGLIQNVAHAEHQRGPPLLLAEGHQRLQELAVHSRWRLVHNHQVGIKTEH